MENDPLTQFIGDIIDAANLDAKKIARATAISYFGLAKASATALPLCVVLSETPTISQQQTKQPDIPAHMTSEPHNPMWEKGKTTIVETTGHAKGISRATGLAEALKGVSSRLS